MLRELLDRECARVGVDGDTPFTNDSLPLGRPISSADNAAGCPSSAAHWSSRHLSAFNTRLGRQSRPLALFFFLFFFFTKEVTSTIPALDTPETAI